MRGSRVDEVDAAALVREVREGERWIEGVESFWVKAESVWTTSAREIEIRREEKRRQFPEMEITAERFSGLAEVSTSTEAYAFDRQRFYSHEHWPAHRDEVLAWDGTRGFTRMAHPASGREQYGITLDRCMGRHVYDWFSWPRAGRHELWWNQPLVRDPEGDAWVAKLRGEAEDFRYLRREVVEGVECYVLGLLEPRLTRWYVGVEDHLLYRLERGDLATEAEQVAAVIEEARALGEHLSTKEEVMRWVQTLPAEKGEEIWRAAMRRVYRTCHASGGHAMGDYREVKPGCWYPFRQGYWYMGSSGENHTKSDEDAVHPWESFRREIRVVELQVDRELPGELFRVEFKEGNQVWDQTSDPPLSYKYKKERGAAEWEEMVGKARVEKEEMEAAKRGRDALIGKAAPAFPGTGWFNGGPLAWEGLRGRPVIVDFFSDWCGPCRNDLPLARGIYEAREKNGVVIVGVHTPGVAREKLEKFLKMYGIEYPVCVDVAVEKGAWGKLFGAYGVNQLPFAVLVDGEGRVAGHGSLGEMMGRAGEMVRGGI